jgi:acyl-CoA thioester hydrolase
MSEQKPKAFVWPMRVYYEDTDANGVVYHARYLNFFERARTELLRAHGINNQAILEEHKLAWVVLDIQVRFVKAAKLDDELLVSAELSWKKGVRQGFRQVMHRVADGELIATAELSAAMLHADSLKPARMPVWLEAKFKHDE